MSQDNVKGGLTKIPGHVTMMSPVSGAVMDRHPPTLLHPPLDNTSLNNRQHEHQQLVSVPLFLLLLLWQLNTTHL
ncbi:hypothetical protein C0Q70_19827 [Pomacea canaliculata]|uniref:Uncharacterized protein n=1 Tax=Pomacea canaliculata TaxID=400727 RepID=A0A2T7NDT6_POMCA|nr:hypothetical protein C0Q70_19827 [Pomacea canaliculata]